MTKGFKMVLVGAMLAGLMVAPLGVAQADDIIRNNGTGTGFDVTIPNVKIEDSTAPKLEVELDGEKKTIGGDAISGTSTGGVLHVAFRVSDWVVSKTSANCPTGQIGTSVHMTGKYPTATLQASWTPTGGATEHLLGPGSATPDRPNPVFNLDLCL